MDAIFKGVFDNELTQVIEVGRFSPLPWRVTCAWTHYGGGIYVEKRAY